jgi:hypothetical protein
VIVRVGDVVESDFGRGKIVAITKFWIVHEIGVHEKQEVAVSRLDNWIAIPVTGTEEGGGMNETELGASS